MGCTSKPLWIVLCPHRVSLSVAAVGLAAMANCTQKPFERTFSRSEFIYIKASTIKFLYGPFLLVCIPPFQLERRLGLAGGDHSDCFDSQQPAWRSRLDSGIRSVASLEYWLVLFKHESYVLAQPRWTRTAPDSTVGTPLVEPLNLN